MIFGNVITLQIILRNRFREITTCSKLQVCKWSMVNFCFKSRAKLKEARFQKATLPFPIPGKEKKVN